MKKDGQFFPALINVSKFKILVVGGGNVAARKVENLLKFGASDILVIAPEINEQIKKYAEKGSVKIEKRKYREGDAKGFRLAFCAVGDKKVDELVRSDCDKFGVFLNVADVPELCDFILPATLKRGNLTISVGSQGSAPFYVKETKKKLSVVFPSETSLVADLAGEFRNALKERHIYENKTKRDQLIKSFFSYDWEEIIANQGYDAARSIMNSLIK